MTTYHHYRDQSTLEAYLSYTLNTLCHVPSKTFKLVTFHAANLYQTMEEVPYKKAPNEYHNQVITSPLNLSHKITSETLNTNEPFLVLSVWRLQPKEQQPIHNSMKVNGKFNKFQPYVIPILEPVKLNIAPQPKPTTKRQQQQQQETRASLLETLSKDQKDFPPAYAFLFHVLTKHGTVKWCTLEPLTVQPYE